MRIQGCRIKKRLLRSFSGADSAWGGWKNAVTSPGMHRPNRPALMAPASSSAPERAPEKAQAANKANRIVSRDTVVILALFFMFLIIPCLSASRYASGAPPVGDGKKQAQHRDCFFAWNFKKKQLFVF